MSDPNIRRWLSWTNLAYVSELDAISDANGIALPHLWIKTISHSAELQSFMDVSLRHMGVKIGVIESYDKVGETLEKIM